jgi:ABC-type multidrug transport system ATPase subunit
VSRAWPRRRQVDIASSLLTRPQVLFLDEPATGLDPRSRTEIWAVVRELRREGTTLLLTTQYLEEADQLAGRIAIIDRRTVIAEETGNELKDRVGGQILEVELSSPGQRDRAQAVLAGVGCGEPEPGERPAGRIHPHARMALPADQLSRKPAQNTDIVRQEADGSTAERDKARRPDRSAHPAARGDRPITEPDRCRRQACPLEPMAACGR